MSGGAGERGQSGSGEEGHLEFGERRECVGGRRIDPGDRVQVQECGAYRKWKRLPVLTSSHCHEVVSPHVMQFSRRKY